MLRGALVTARPPRTAASPASPAVLVQVMQAMVARELVGAFGVPERQAAELLGLVPSAVSQYLSGKRLGPKLALYLSEEPARRIARAAAQRLLSDSGGPAIVLEAAIELGAIGPSAGSTRSSSLGRVPEPGPSPELTRSLRRRIVGEQRAVAECMRLAQRSRDELTRALFRQIASDSLRHAEIVASIAAYLDRGVTASLPTGITRRDVELLIEREHRAEEAEGESVDPAVGGVMRILWESMEADERKHELLLERLLADAPAAVDRPSERPPPAERPRRSHRPTPSPRGRPKRQL